jgi:hypothetical protein
MLTPIQETAIFAIVHWTDDVKVSWMQFVKGVNIFYFMLTGLF